MNHRSHLIKSFSLVVIILVLLGCSKTEKTARHLVVATDATYQPFEYYNEAHELVGFDIDLFNALAAQAGFTVTFKNQPFDGIIAGLEAGKYDAVISSLSITEERAKRILFTDPYYDAGQLIAVRSDQTGIETLDDLKGVRIGVQRGTTGAAKAKEVSDAQVSEYDTIDLAFLALKDGKVDAVLNDGPTSRSIVASQRGFKLVGVPLTDEKYGIAVGKKEVELAAALNIALAKLKEDGTLERIQRKWLEPK